jgi:D-alanyl-D-alanine carboxypeptidase/D-alanyl-D-alanine-endopeptidase (penicillin-binding protein 4)
MGRTRRNRTVGPLLVASVAFVLAAGGFPEASAAPAAGPAGTSLLSPRRLPDWLATTAAGRRVAASLSSVLSTAALGSAATTTCALVTQGGRTLAALDPGDALIPASNMKILTASAALDKLGPGFRYTTKVTATAAPVGGVLTGNLYLVGSGDPFLRTAAYVAAQPYQEPTYTSLAQLAAQVKAAGITSVTGSVVGDESRYDTQRAVPTWKPDYTSEGDAGPLSALDVDDGFVLTGSTYEASPQPAVSAATQFAALLEAEGITVTGPPTDGVSPPTAVAVTSIQSAPLSQLLGTILTVSDDTGAELVTKELGAEFGGAGTTTAGVAVITADLTAHHLPMTGFSALDGSGLDRSDRVSCRLLDADLAREGPTSVLAAGLPVAGRTGTLDDRLTAPITLGRILAKTGTLDGVAALSGFVLAPAGATAPAPGLDRPLVFSLVMNGLSGDTVGVTLGDALATALAAYPAVPAASTLGPATGVTGSSSSPTGGGS